MDRWLVYATGGLAYGEVRTDASITVPLVGTSTGSFNETRTGWVVGAGVEAAVSGSWTVKFEYLHVDLGNVTTNLLSTNGGGAFAGTIVGTSRVTDDIMRVGLNYRWGVPVVARY